MFRIQNQHLVLKHTTLRLYELGAHTLSNLIKQTQFRCQTNKKIQFYILIREHLNVVWETEREAFSNLHYQVK